MLDSLIMISSVLFIVFFVVTALVIREQHNRGTKDE